MTLNIDQWLANEIQKTAKIHHLDVKVWSGKKSKLKGSKKEKIVSEFGEHSLESADYLIFFKGEELSTADGMNSLFSVVDSALGKNANNLTKGDLKKVASKDDEGNETLDFIFLQITLN